MVRLVGAAVLLLTCAAHAAPSGRGRGTTKQIDDWLRARGLNVYGDHKAMQYRLNPLQDQKTGAVTDRYDYLRRKFPDSPWLTTAGTTASAASPAGHSTFSQAKAKTGTHADRYKEYAQRLREARAQVTTEEPAPKSTSGTAAPEITFEPHDGLITAAGDIGSAVLTIPEAQRRCGADPVCQGFSYRSGGAAKGAARHVIFKTRFEISRAVGWTSYKKFLHPPSTEETETAGSPSPAPSPVTPVTAPPPSPSAPPATDLVQPDAQATPADATTPPPAPAPADATTPPPDAAAPLADVATLPPDPTAPPPDAATPPPDPTAPPDATTPPPDAAAPLADAATLPPDPTAPPPDAATPPPDPTAPPDATTPPPDAAAPLADAATLP
eukprot:Hpha_TRINITY_DN12488_c0_g1::TRINITY_DN12488_c0_g1_i4::g.42961::m.42961